MALLISLSGVPGAGKTTIARQLAQDSGAIHIEVDLIEAAIRRNVPIDALEESDRYRAAYGVAKVMVESLLRSGATVIVDAVNGIAAIRDLWVSAATAAAAQIIEVQVICSDEAEHGRRLQEGRDPNRTGPSRSL